MRCVIAPSHLKFALNSSRPRQVLTQRLQTIFLKILRLMPSSPDLEPKSGSMATGSGLERALLPIGRATRLSPLSSRMGFAPHAPQFQTPGKASFAVPGKEAYALVIAELERNHLPFQALFSGESDLDLLAPGAGKDAATPISGGILWNYARQDHRSRRFRQ